MEPAPDSDRSRLEWLGVAVVTLLGAGARLWPPGRFGLTHFDEGIYALSATWAASPQGLEAIDPMLIPYAPPGFPILAGIASGFLGRPDASAIAISQAAGTLTIPVVAWLARRAFGSGSGFLAATFAAFSGPHIAFSRMALTDASFLLSWLLAIGAGMRFLERPNASRAALMGLGVGLAQEFKYNGWLAGAIVIGAASLGPIARSEDRRPGSIARIFGWGLLGAGVAWLVVWPWYRFVERHGGYSDLLRHQRSYLGGLGDWWPHLRTQADQAVALSGGRGLIWLTLGIAGLGLLLVRPVPPGPRPRVLIAAFVLGFLPFLFLDSPYWLGLILLPWLLTWPMPAVRIVGVWWALLAVMTPFYHPYSRLWLPFHAANWILMGWLGPNLLAAQAEWRDRPRALRLDRLRRRLELGFVIVTLLAGLALKVATEERSVTQPDLLAPSDSLRRASSRVASILPEEVAGLRILVRPSVTYYLAGRVPLMPMAGSDQLRSAGHPQVWALVDSAILRSETGRTSEVSSQVLLGPFLDRWEIVEEFPSTLSLPTLLDLDPGAAREPSATRSSPLWLLRPRRPGVRR